jgi:hypothetical protein
VSDAAGGGLTECTRSAQRCRGGRYRRGVSSPSESTDERTEPGAAPWPGEHGVAVSIACPSCHRLVAVGTPCPRCGAEPVSASPAPAEPTAVLPPVPERTAELEIPADMLEPPPFMPLEAPATAVDREPSRARRGGAVLAGAAALVLVGAAAVAGLRGGDGSDVATRTTSGGTPAASGIAPVTPAGVSASSTQRPDDGVSYAASNTVDGRPETAWNSDGQGAGATLTYTFSQPVDLRSVTVRNGYQKTLRRSDGSPVDLYRLNERVKAVKVVTDAGSLTWTLRDDPVPQTLTHAFGTTSSVRLEVLSVYPSSRYKDLAVSDVAFAAGSTP